MDSARRIKNILLAEELISTVGTHNHILDPHSTLLGATVKVGNNNTFYPNVVITSEGEGVISIGDNNIFYPGTYVFCGQGSITIGNANEFGTGGCTLRANTPDAKLLIGNGGRYTDGANIMGITSLGSGSQVLGAITVQSCTLDEGETYLHSDPSMRAPVLKGFGLARNLTLRPGQVVNGLGDFSQAPIESQLAYHPPKKDL